MAPVPQKTAEPTLLRLASQLPSQKREALRQTRFGSKHTGSLVRSRTRVQSAHPLFDGNATEVRPLGSTGITPLPRYYGPLRLPTAAARQVMDSLPALSRQQPGGHRVGSPRFLRPSFDTRPPQSPRTARRMPSLVASPPMAGFTLSGRLAAVVFVYRGRNGFTCVRARVFAVRRGSPPVACNQNLQTDLLPTVGCPPAGDRSYMANEQLTCLTPPSQVDGPGFAWRTEAHEAAQRRHAVTAVLRASS